MRRWFIPVLLVVLLGSGCSRPDVPVLQPGDVIRPEIAFAPQAPWPPEAKVALGMLIKVHRPGGEARYLDDKDVTPEQAVMRARVTFLDGELQLGDPLEVAFVRDC
ncbi:MAG TPA: hypothetical protein VE999_01230 [Gemmataceae bacterium]|nr:hypothetical protein [Gemmataceae bacterium]